MKGNKSPDLVRGYAQALGFTYLTASTKEEYLANLERFVSPELSEKPILFEVFTEMERESESLDILYNLVKNPPEEGA